MTLSLDSYLGIHAKALVARDQRASQLANNLANINTPNYKAQDVDFNELLTATMAQGDGSNTMKTPIQDTFNANLKYRVPSHYSMDGNTVDKDMETTEFARNSLNYQASLSFLDNKIKTMMLAIKGE